MIILKAGLKSGDLITTVEGKSAENPETFRVLLRRALAVDEGIHLRVLRGGKNVEMFVQPPPLH